MISKGYLSPLFHYTKMRNVAGITQTEAQKSSDLFMKCRYLDELTGSRGVVFATGTPISNSMTELYTMQRYLQYELLREYDLIHFDAWASTFGETITAVELSPEGTSYRAKTRFAKFYNLPELMSMFKMTADIKTADMLNLPVPKANFHNEVVPASDLQKEMVAALAERAEAVRSGTVDASHDNMLVITNDGRKLALDQRLSNPLLPFDENGKVAKCIENVYDIYQKTAEKRLAQIIFCDISTPKKGDNAFNVYSDIKTRLIEKGVRQEDIAFIHDANTELQKEELFAKVRSGKIRILMGSTAKMGSGTNCQDKLIAMHDLDCPWRPSDLEQRLGRIVRRGNTNKEVEIYRYVTEGTFDSYLFQLVEQKQKFISQIMTSKSPARTMEDVDEAVLSYAEIKALATGNPLIIEKSELDLEVSKLKTLKSSFLSQRYELEDMIVKHYPVEIKRLTEMKAGYEQDVERVSESLPAETEEFSGMDIGGTHFTEKKDAGAALLQACNQIRSAEQISIIGHYRGFSMALSFDTFHSEYHLTLKHTLSHVTALGSDALGNMTRIDNVLNGLQEKRDTCIAKLANAKAQQKNAEKQILEPFTKERELAAKLVRLNEVNALLGMNETDHTLTADTPADMEAPETIRAPRQEAR